MAEPISLHCGEDKKLSAGDVGGSCERQQGIPRAMGASESLALCELCLLILH